MWILEVLFYSPHLGLHFKTGLVSLRPPDHIHFIAPISPLRQTLPCRFIPAGCQASLFEVGPRVKAGYRMRQNGVKKWTKNGRFLQ